MSTRTWLLLIGGMLTLCVCAGLTAMLSLAGSLYFGTEAGLPAVSTVKPSAVAAATIVPVVTRAPATTASPAPLNPTTAAPTSAPPANEAPASAESVFNNPLPRANLVDLAIHYKGVPRDTKVECAVRRAEQNVGDRREFTLSNSDNNTLFKITAELRVKTANVYAWVEVSPDALNIDQSKLTGAMEQFSNEIVPTNRNFFGSEANPGVDCDPHLHIMHASGVGKSVGGYFSSTDSYPINVRADSNEGEMFLMHAAPSYNGADPGSSNYMSTLAHEFQHMISHNQNHAPDLWLEEGAAQFAERLNGMFPDRDEGLTKFATQPETQLNIWDESSAGENSKHYNAAYLWWSYINDRFGEQIAQRLMREKERSAHGIVRALGEAGNKNPDTGKAYTFPELFQDWVIANYDGKIPITGAEKRYNYGPTQLPQFSARARLNAANYPYNKHEVLNQFGTHYYELRGNKPITVEFKGAERVSLLPMNDNDGVFWWSGRGDMTNSRLTREFDLTEAGTKLTLRFRAWFRLEKDYDYAFASISDNNGATWKTLTTTHCSSEDPNKANFGCGYTGSSGGAPKASPVWTQEMADLGPYAGKKVLIRFEIVTDPAVHREGLAVDNIEIPELGFRDEVSNSNGWKAEGWQRVSNVLPQSWAVQAIVIKDDNTRQLQRMTLEASGSGQFKIELGPGVKSAVLAVSPTTQVTTVQASYDIAIK